jgi:hypothetical protein
MNPRLLRPLASGKFDPRTIAGLAAWYDATVSSSLFDAVSGGSPSVSDGAVMRWEDLSGNNNHLTQPGDVVNDAPLRKVADANTAGKDAVLFDGSNDLLRVTSTIATGSGGSLFIVHKRQSDNNGGIHSFSGVTPSNHHPFLGSFFDGFASGTRRSWTQAFSTVRRLYSVVSGTSWVAYINNSAVNTVTGVTPAAQQFNVLQTFGAGAYAISTGSASNFAHTYICEIVIYSRALLAAEHSAVSNYLIKKWSL